MIPPCRRVVDSGVWAYRAYTVCTCCRAHGRGLWRGSLPASGPTLTPYLIKRSTQTKKRWLKRNMIAWGITVHCKICNTDSLSKEHCEPECKQAELCCYISLTNLYIRHRIFCFILGKCVSLYVHASENQGDANFLVTEVLDMNINLLDIYKKMFQYFSPSHVFTNCTATLGEVIISILTYPED